MPVKQSSSEHALTGSWCGSDAGGPARSCGGEGGVMARGSLGLGGEARRVDEHDPSRLAALRTTPAAPWCFGKRASLARLALPVQRLLGWNLTAVLIYVMDIERSIRMQEERTRSADAGELVHMFDRRKRKPTRMQVHCGFAFHFHPARAAHHHQLFVGRMKVPGRATAFRALHQQDRRPVRWVT